MHMPDCVEDLGEIQIGQEETAGNMQRVRRGLRNSGEHVASRASRQKAVLQQADQPITFWMLHDCAAGDSFNEFRDILKQGGRAIVRSFVLGTVLVD